MHAILLAAGRGSRMGAHAETVHKSLLRIGAETLIVRMIDGLDACGVDAITIVTGHEADRIREQLTDQYPNRQFKFVHNPDYATTNNIVSLHMALETLPSGEDVLIVEGDLICDRLVLERVLANPSPNIALVSPYQRGMDGTLAVLRGDTIERLVLSHQQTDGFKPDGAYKTVNIYKLGAEFCDLHYRPRLAAAVSAGSRNDYYEAVLSEMLLEPALHGALRAEVADPGSWSEIDNPHDLEIARFRFEPENRRAQLDKAFGGLWNFPVADYCYPKNARFPDARALNELQEHLQALITNYGSAQHVLDRKMADFMGCLPRFTVALNGLSQVYPFLRNRFINARVLLPTPSFGEYARMFPDADTYDDEVGIDVEALQKRLTNFDVVVFVNPNNPTGSWISPMAISGWAHEYPRQTFIVDESFAAFACAPGLLQTCAELPENVIVLNSLGKSLGVPGVRLGMAYSSSSDFIKALRAELPIWNMNAVAEAMLEMALRRRADINRTFQQVRTDRDAMAESLKRNPAVENVWPSEGNFLLVRLHLPKERLGAFLDHLLQHHGFHVKDISAKFRQSGAWVRLSVGLPEQNERLLEAMTNAFQALSRTS